MDLEHDFSEAERALMTAPRTRRTDANARQRPEQAMPMIVAICANGMLLIVWLLFLRINLYQGAGISVGVITLYSFGLLVAIPIAIANEILITPRIISRLTARSRARQAVLLTAMGFTLAACLYGLMLAVTQIRGAEHLGPQWFVFAYSWSTVIVMLLTHTIVLLAPPCLLVTAVRVLSTSQTQTGTQPTLQH